MIEPRILMLLSDPRLRDIYLSRFEREGWTVEEAVHLKDAERRAVQLRPTIFLVDYKLLEEPRAALKHLHSLPTMQKTHIVILARALSREAVRELHAAGAEHVVLSGHDTPQELVKRMQSLITSL